MRIQQKIALSIVILIYLYICYHGGIILFTLNPFDVNAFQLIAAVIFAFSASVLGFALVGFLIMIPLCFTYWYIFKSHVQTWRSYYRFYLFNEYDK